MGGKGFSEERERGGGRAAESLVAPLALPPCSFAGARLPPAVSKGVCGGKGCHRAPGVRAAAALPAPASPAVPSAGWRRGRAAPLPHACPAASRQPAGKLLCSQSSRGGWAAAGGRRGPPRGRPAPPPARPLGPGEPLSSPRVQVSPAASGDFPVGEPREENPCVPSPIASPYVAGGRGG